jgi:hypothetical protein
MRPTTLFQFRGIVLRPAKDGGMIDVQPPFPHHFLQVAIAQGIPKIPTGTEQDDLSFEMTPFEQTRIVLERSSSSFLE